MAKGVDGLLKDAAISQQKRMPPTTTALWNFGTRLSVWL
jgi:hypothetical protein